MAEVEKTDSARELAHGPEPLAGPEPSRHAEDQHTISAWATETFGAAGTNLSVALRAAEEMAELVQALEVDDSHPKAPEEAADVVIVLMRLFSRYGTTLQAEMDRKMAINRARKWRLTGTGHGYHVKEGAQPEALTLPEAKEGGSSGGNALASPDGLTDAQHSAGWLRSNNLIYTLTNTGRWRDGRPVMVNRLEVTVHWNRHHVLDAEGEAVVERLHALLSSEAPPVSPSPSLGGNLPPAEPPSPNPPVKVEKSWCEMCGGAGRLYSLDRMASADCEWCPTDVSSGKGS